jgi:predicted signal transduction protein with EAL and GGDEF domain
MLTLGLPVLLLPVPILAVFAWLIRRHPPSPSRSVFRRDGIVRLAVLAAVAVSTSFALALAAELARPWTLEIARVTF